MKNYRVHDEENHTMGRTTRWEELHDGFFKVKQGRKAARPLDSPFLIKMHGESQ
jgi:hypothetical protein